MSAENPAVLLSRVDCGAFLTRCGGARMSSLLQQDGSSAGRLVSGFETAGAASVETNRNYLSCFLRLHLKAWFWADKPRQRLRIS